MAKTKFEILSTVIVEASAVGGKENVTFSASSEPVMIEESYGDHLVSLNLAAKVGKKAETSKKQAEIDRLAEEKAKKQAEIDRLAEEKAKKQAEIDRLAEEKAKEQAENERLAAISAAETAVSDAEKVLADAVSDEDKAAAGELLAAAQATLEGLKA